LGGILVEVATAVRRYKSERNLSLGTKIARLGLATKDAALAQRLRAAAPDLVSVTRAEGVEVAAELDPALEPVQAEGTVKVALRME
jgi:hypothetical protein